MKLVVLLLAALIPLVVGSIWFSKKVFGNAFIKASNLTGDAPSGKHMAITYILTYVLSFFITVVISTMAIHQSHLGGIFFGHDFTDPSTQAGGLYKGIMDNFGMAYRTFKHGSLHGALAGLFLVMPIIAINAMFEKRGFKYIAISAGYWIVSMALIGGVVCAYF